MFEKLKKLLELELKEQKTFQLESTRMETNIQHGSL